MYKAFLFDLDGTLIDSEGLKIRAKQEAVAHCGGIVSFDDVMQFVGKSEQEVCSSLLKMAGVETDWRHVPKEAEKAYLKMLEAGIELNPGVPSFLNAAKEKDIKMALVTSSTELMLAHNPAVELIKPYFETIIHADSVDEHKPSPKPYQKALEELQLMSEEAIAFEDSGSGLKSAVAAGIPCVFIRHHLNHAIHAHEALLEVHSFEDKQLQDLLNNI